MTDRYHEEEPDGPDIRLIHGVSAAKVRPSRVQWLWADMIPAGKLTILDGLPDVLKTTVGTDLCARVTSGRSMPCCEVLRVPGNAAFITYEDDKEDTLQPRFLAAGGDPEWMTWVDGNEEEVSFPSSEAGLFEFVRRLDLRLLVIDPVMAALDRDIKSASDQDVRRALGSLRWVAKETGVPIICVRHLNKKTSERSALMRGGGSIGIAAIARSVLLAGKDPEDDTRKVLAKVKGNLGPNKAPSLAYRAETVFIPNGKKEPIETSRIEWLGPVKCSADDLVAGPTAGDKSELDNAVGIVAEVLANGRMRSTELDKYCKDAGILPSTVRDARKKLGVKARPVRDELNGTSRWYVSLPDKEERSHATAAED